jgi:hypothetical protein
VSYTWVAIVIGDVTGQRCHSRVVVVTIKFERDFRSLEILAEADEILFIYGCLLCKVECETALTVEHRAYNVA